MEKRNPRALLVRMHTPAPTEESLMTQQFYFWHTSGEAQNTNLKEYMHPCVQCSITYNSQAAEATCMPVNRRVDKEEAVHIHNGILPGHKK